MARLYGNAENRSSLRAVASDEALFEVFTGLLASQAA